MKPEAEMPEARSQKPAISGPSKPRLDCRHSNELCLVNQEAQHRYLHDRQHRLVVHHVYSRRPLPNILPLLSHRLHLPCRILPGPLQSRSHRTRSQCLPYPLHPARHGLPGHHAHSSRPHPHSHSVSLPYTFRPLLPSTVQPNMVSPPRTANPRRYSRRTWLLASHSLACTL